MLSSIRHSVCVSVRLHLKCTPPMPYVCRHTYSIHVHLGCWHVGVIAARTARDKQDMLRGVGRWPVDTAEEAAVRRRRGGRRREGRKKMGRRATHCRGQSALTAAGVAEWYLSRLDRWTDRATPRWTALAVDASVSHQREGAHTPTQQTHEHLYKHREILTHCETKKNTRLQEECSDTSAGQRRI